jgi:hypothetical protein
MRFHIYDIIILGERERGWFFTKIWKVAEISILGKTSTSFTHLVRKDMDVINEHERISNFILTCRLKLK